MSKSRARAILLLLWLSPPAIRQASAAGAGRQAGASLSPADAAGIAAAWTPAVPALAGADRVVLPGAGHPLARPEVEVGRTDPRLPLARLVLVLALRPGARPRLDALLAEQQDPASPRYRRWLTPEELGADFGLGDREVARVAGWLAAQGFTIDEVAKGRGWIDFSGNVRQVEQAFATEMHDYRIGGVLRHAAAAPPSVPRELAPLVAGIVSLHDVPLAAAGPRPPPAGAPGAPDGTAPRDGAPAGGHLLAPADLATIYHLRPLYDAGVDGTGESIAVLARTDIQLADVQAFRSWFGLPARDPVFVYNGIDPGIVNFYDQGESSLDVEWAGATAPGATVKLVISGSTGGTDGITLSAQYAVEHNLAPVVSLSYGQCELALGQSALAFWSHLWAQAAAQGITVMVAAGDSGPATCDPPTRATAGMASVNGLCSTPYDVCVGGAELDDAASPASWWSPGVDPVTKGSALSYIPEVAWNESGAVAGGSGLWAGGGGASGFSGKPAWQSAPGVPDDGARDVPDVALTAARRTPYVYFEDGQALTVGGTSGATPSFAGIMALLVQRARQRQGNANPAFYGLAAGQYGGAGPAVFHDVVRGDTGVPGLGGFGAGPGYDQATGLGTVDGTALVAHWPSLAAAACAPGPATLCLDDLPGDGRFAVTVSFAAGSRSGDATAVPLGSVGIAQGGVFWFFAPSNPELLIKVLDACPLNQKLWVFYAATTNVGFTVSVTDIRTGRVKRYTNPAGTAAPPLQDTAAFDCG